MREVGPKLGMCRDVGNFRKNRLSDEKYRVSYRNRGNLSESDRSRSEYGRNVSGYDGNLSERVGIL